MKTEETIKIFEFLNSRYKVTIYHGSDVMEIEELVKCGFWESVFKNQDYEWQRVYFGHITPLEQFVNLYNNTIKTPNPTAQK